MADASVMPSIISAPIKGPQSICGEPTGWSTNRSANDRFWPKAAVRDRPLPIQSGRCQRGAYSLLKPIVLRRASWTLVALL